MGNQSTKPPQSLPTGRIQVILEGEEAERFNRYLETERLSYIIVAGRRLLLDGLEQWEAAKAAAAI